MSNTEMTMTRRERRAEERASRKPWSGKKKWLVFAGAPVTLLGTTAAAAAVFAALAGIQGGGQTGDFTAKWAATVPVMDTASMTVQPAGAASVSGGKLALPDLTIYPAESFTVEAAVVAGGANQTGYVSGVQMPGLPSGYKAEVVSGCGAKVTTSMTSVKVRVTAPATQAAGASWTLAADAGVRVTPLAQGASAPAGTTCAVYTAP